MRATCLWDLSEAQCPDETLRHPLCLHGQHLPQPYGGDAGFEQVLDLVEDACNDLLLHVQKAGV